MQGTEPKEALSTELNRLAEIAARDPKVKFTSLAHLLTEDFLKGCYRELNHQAAAGVDQVSYAIERRINNATIKVKKGGVRIARCMRAKVTERQPSGRFHQPVQP